MEFIFDAEQQQYNLIPLVVYQAETNGKIHLFETRLVAVSHTALYEF